MKYVLASAVIAAALVTGGQASAQAVGIATSNPGSIFHNIGTAVANAANQAGINATIQPATSPNQYIPFVASGGIEFGAANLQEVNYALEGKEWFEGSVNADAFIAGDAVGFIFAHGAGKVREADAAVGGLRALPIEENEENLATIREHWPVGFFATMEPGPNAPGVEETSTYFAYPQVIFTHAGVDEETVYQMTKAIYESKEAMAQTFPPFNAFDPTDMASDTGASEFHPGAIRFYKEVGIWKE